jgi:CRISPR-associated endonuclease Cas3-HD
VWAHSSNGSGQRHLLADHARATAALGRRIGQSFGAADLCWALGLLHDAGKAAPQWQRKLLTVEGTDRPVGLPHKQLGGHILTARAGPAAMCVLGHHGVGGRGVVHPPGVEGGAGDVLVYDSVGRGGRAGGDLLEAGVQLAGGCG